VKAVTFRYSLLTFHTKRVKLCNDYKLTVEMRRVERTDLVLNLESIEMDDALNAWHVRTVFGTSQHFGA
jgi:hypothetical protein